MIIVLALIILSFLSGCSWFYPPEKKETITEMLITPDKHPIESAPDVEPPSQEVINEPEVPPLEPESTVELHKPEPHPLINQNLQAQNLESIEPIVISKKEKKYRRKRRSKQEKKPLPSIPKTIIELAEKPSEEIMLQHPSFSSTTEMPQAQQASEPRKITIHNTIDKPMVTVKHWTGKYVPTLLNITINGNKRELVQNKEVISFKDFPIDVQNNTFTIDFNYEFMNGRRKGSSSTTYRVAPETQKLNMSFSWDNAWHVEFDNAKPIVTREH